MKKSGLLVGAALAAVLGLSACETAYNPLEVCTAGWISERADRAMSEFSGDVSSSLKTIRRASSDYQRTGKFNALQVVSLVSALSNLVNKFEDSRALRDLRVLERTCGDPTVVKLAFTRFLYDQGAPQRLLDLLNDIDQYQNLIENAGR
jgi:hypothetical protein